MALTALTSNLWRSLTLMAVFAGLAMVWTAAITEAPVDGDARETLRMGVNLAHYGVISGEETAPVEPTMYREPVPAVTTAIAVRIVDAVLDKADRGAYSAGVRFKYVKYQNLLWAAMMTGAVLGLLRVLTGSFPLAVLGAAAVNFDLPLYPNPDLDTLMTEPPARALLATTAFLLAWWGRRGGWIPLALAGLVFGLLALTKALFLYVFIGLLLALPLLHVLFERAASPSSRQPWRKLAADAGVLSGAFFLVTVPWMIRNYVQLDAFAISERAGVVLMQRAVLNGLAPEEYLGGLYLFAPNRRLQAVVAGVTGFGPEDLQRGGRLQRLYHGASDYAEEDLAAELEGRPEDAVSFHRSARAWRTRLTDEYRAAGHDRPASLADEELQRRALGLIRENPWRHAAFVGLALWRGALFSLPILLAGLIYAVRSDRRDVALTVLPPLGMIALYALVSNFEYRFGTPVSPVTVAIPLVLLAAAWRRLRDGSPTASRAR